MNETSPAPSTKASLDLGVIGNGTIAALIDQSANIVWSCFPRLDSDPIFCSLIMGSKETGHGCFSISLIDQVRSKQRYLKNSAILETTLFDAHDGSIQILDFAPRHEHYGRLFHPTMLVRRIHCLKGMPRVTIRVTPSTHKGEKPAPRILGSNHIRFQTQDQALRLTTDESANLIFREIPFVVQKDFTLVLGPDEPLSESPEYIGKDLFTKTMTYWQNWVRRLALPTQWQNVVIRAAITLKLCHYEETGGIVAALTTSIPENDGSGRNFDYRYCWLRDAFFVIQALVQLNEVETMESYISYVKNIVVNARNQPLQPIYGLSFEKNLPEITIEHLAGYRDNAPVRFGNNAYSQVQHDSYGSIILALVPYFFDERLDHVGDMQLFSLFEELGEQALASWNNPDPGIWEYRSHEGVHTHSAAMCWAACDRLAKISGKLELSEKQNYWQNHAKTIHTTILEKAWNEEIQIISSSFGGDNVDASVLLLPEIGLLKATDPRFLKTLEVVEKTLLHGKAMYRYFHEDDFGFPKTAFNICSLWYAKTLKRVGREEEACAVFEDVLSRCTHLGHLSEDSDPETGEAWGNFPQTYSHVGLIQVALLLSSPWEDVV